MADDVEIMKLEVTEDFRFDEYDRLFRSNDMKARGMVGLQLLNNIINGSPGESVVAPILTGLLRGSGSVFVGSKVIGFSPRINNEGNPATVIREDPGVVTVAFNTGYAAKLHEYPFRPGPISQQSGNVGYKFIIKHVSADRNELMDLYATFIRKNTV